MLFRIFLECLVSVKGCLWDRVETFRFGIAFEFRCRKACSGEIIETLSVLKAKFGESLIHDVFEGDTCNLRHSGAFPDPIESLVSVLAFLNFRLSVEEKDV